MWKKIIPLLVLLIFSLLFHWDILIQQNIYTSYDLGRSDISHLNYPLKDFLSQSLKSFRLPLWTDQIYTGFPILAEGQIGAFYLPNILLYFLLPTYLAFNLSYFFSSFIASVGVYMFCRQFKINKSSAIFAGTAYAYSMFFVAHILHPNLLNSTSLIPWLFYLYEKLSTSKNRFYLIALALLVSQQIFTGFFQTTTYTIIGLFLYATLRKFKSQTLPKNLMKLLLAILLGIGLSAIQILPTFELYKLSIRIKYTTAETLVYPFTAKDLLYFLNPFIYGDPSKATFRPNPDDGLFWENNTYIGLLPLIFALLAITQIKKTPAILAFFLLFLITIFFSLRLFSPLYLIFPFSQFRLPQKALSLSILSLTVLSGFGLNNFIEKFFVKFKSSKSIRKIIPICIIALAFADLYFWEHSYNGGINYKKWLEPPQTAKFLQSQKNQSRIYTIDEFRNWFLVYENIAHGWRDNSSEKILSTRTILDPDINMIFHIPNSNGYLPLQLQTNNLISLLINPGIKMTGEHQFTITQNSLKLLGMQNTGYLISANELIGDKLKEVYQYYEPKSKTTYKIYQNNYLVDRIHPVKEIKAFPTSKELLSQLTSDSFDPQTTAYFLGAYNDLKLNSDVKIDSINTKVDSLEFRTTSPDNSFIVVADSNYPGWEVLIDNQKEPIYQINIKSRGLFVPPGEHQIKMSYHPQSLRRGFLISLFFLIISLIFLFFPKTSSFRSRPIEAKV